MWTKRNTRYFGSVFTPWREPVAAAVRTDLRKKLV